MATYKWVEVWQRRRKYYWPEAQLNFFLTIMLAAGATIMGINAYFMIVQNQVKAGQIWYAPLLHPPYAPSALPWCVEKNFSLLFYAHMVCVT